MGLRGVQPTGCPRYNQVASRTGRQAGRPTIPGGCASPLCGGRSAAAPSPATSPDPWALARALGWVGVRGGRLAAVCVPRTEWGPRPVKQRAGACVPAFDSCFLYFFLLESHEFFDCLWGPGLPLLCPGGVPVGFGGWCGCRWRSACSRCRLCAVVMVLCLSPSTLSFDAGQYVAAGVC